MGDLAIRRNRGFSVPRYQAAEQTEKTAAAAKTQSAEKTAALSKALQQLMTRAAQAESGVRESRQTLRTGEGVLAEVQDRLGRMAELAQKAGQGEDADRGVLQAELEQLCAEIDRILTGASAGGTQLFLEGDDGLASGLEAILSAVTLSAPRETELPNWLTQGLVQENVTPERLLSALGLDGSAGGAELLSAIADSSLDDSPAAAYLASLYLGAVIAGGGNPAELSANPAMALEGLQQLLERIAEGSPPDQAISELTGGVFSDLSDFQVQFTGGMAPELEAFLVDLLLSGGDGLALPDVSLIDSLSQLEGANLELILRLLSAMQSGGADPLALLGAAGPAETDGAVSVLQLGNLQITGSDLSGVAFDAATGQLTVGGSADVTLRGAGQTALSMIRITGSGTVTLQQVQAPLLTVEADAAHIRGAGENTLAEVRLARGVSLTLDGGLLRLGTLRGDSSNTLRLTGGTTAAVGEAEGTLGSLALPVILEGPALLAAQASHVYNTEGQPLAPFDLVWKTLFPNWSGVTQLAVDGRQARMTLFGDVPARLWLERGDRGSPFHTLMFRGRDVQGHPRTRYAYLHWSQQGIFQEFSMYPNPFTITGGEQDRDWAYEEESHTLWILTNQVTAVSGGSGTDGNRSPFSGRLALADGIGAMSLTLGGVVCRVPSGGAFRLGRGNEVTLCLQSGSANIFESGPGSAGISLGDGTSLCIDCPDASLGGRTPGSLHAAGRDGGAGIGRNCGQGRDRTGQILIRGGTVTAHGHGGGAGIGAGKQGPAGPILILGGTVSAAGERGGGAGIGGALGAPAGDISIRGGAITAVAADHAAAIGAGVQGNCGDILITGTARIVKALGGNPGADIGACLFGSCGTVQISGSADIGRAQLRHQAGIPLQTGENTVMLPQFRLSASALGLDRLSIREDARAVEVAVDGARRLVAGIQETYGALYRRLGPDQPAGGPVRDTDEAGTLLQNTRKTIPFHVLPTVPPRTGSRDAKDVQQLLR